PRGYNSACRRLDRHSCRKQDLSPYRRQHDRHGHARGRARARRSRMKRLSARLGARRSTMTCPKMCSWMNLWPRSQARSAAPSSSSPLRLALYTPWGYIDGMRTDIKTSCLKRLKRIEGQVRGLSRMVEDDRYCIDVVTQILAVRAALRRVEEEVLRDH